MYSWELQQYVRDRNYSLTYKEVLFVIDIRKHPQLVMITYNPYSNSYDMYDRDGNHFNFNVGEKGENKYVYN